MFTSAAAWFCIYPKQYGGYGCAAIFVYFTNINLGDGILRRADSCPTFQKICTTIPARRTAGASTYRPDYFDFSLYFPSLLVFCFVPSFPAPRCCGGTSTSIRFLCLGVSHLVGQRDLECIDERARGLSSCVLTTGNLIPKNAGLSRGVNIYSLFGWRRE
jgi:hypothetical protein